jgi:endonuclease YncB( thermonuclease family)
MRTPYLGSAALLALAFGIGAVQWLHREPSMEVAVARVELPPLPPASPPVTLLAPPPPAADKAPDLPTVAIAQPSVHTIDDNAVLPVPTVTLHQKDGRVVVHTATAEPTPSPRPASTAPAPASADTSASVGGLPVHLFGVRPADPRDKCGSGTVAACTDKARAALAARLGSAGNVKCTIPPGQRGDPGFVCRDAAGVDLGRLLVTQGLALADTSASYEYLGAQNEARQSRRGLWAYR